MRTLLVGLLALTALLPTGTAWAVTEGDCPGLAPGLGARLMEMPSRLADNPRAQTRIIDELRPGATIERHVRFSNGEADRDLELAIDAVPASVRDGDFLMDTDDADPELAGWIETGHGEITLGPCEHMDVLATIQVPGDVEGGERYAAVTAEHVPASAGSGVKMASRIGIRVYLYVVGDESASIDFEIEELVPRRTEGGDVAVDIVIDNIGDRALDAVGELELTDGPSGLRFGPVSTDRMTVLGPGEQETSTVTLGPDLPLGPWRAEVTMRSGDLERRAEAEVTFPAQGIGEPVDANPLQDRGFLIPLAVGLLLLALLLLLLVAWRRRRNDDDGGGDGDHGGTPAQEQVGAASLTS